MSVSRVNINSLLRPSRPLSAPKDNPSADCASGAPLQAGARLPIPARPPSLASVTPPGGRPRSTGVLRKTATRVVSSPLYADRPDAPDIGQAGTNLVGGAKSSRDSRKPSLLYEVAKYSALGLGIGALAGIGLGIAVATGPELAAGEIAWLFFGELASLAAGGAIVGALYGLKKHFHIPIPFF